MDFGIFPDQATKSISVRYWVHKNGVPGGGRPDIRYDRDDLEELELVGRYNYESNELTEAVKLMLQTHIADLRDHQRELVLDDNTAMAWLEEAVQELQKSEKP